MQVDRWTAQVAELTRPYREQRAKTLKLEGMKRKEDSWTAFREATELARRMGTPRPDAYDPKLRTGSWHLSRARGQLERFERVAECEEEHTLDVHCGYCGKSSSRAVRCRAALACVSCRGKIAQEKVARLAKARREALSQAAKRGLLRHKRTGGAWTEKLLTLTVPHFAELGIQARIAFLSAARRAFSSKWNKWLKDHPDGQALDTRGYRLARWYRNTEWTTAESSDRKGHPHIHMWFLGPYLPGAKASESVRFSHPVRCHTALAGAGNTRAAIPGPGNTGARSLDAISPGARERFVGGNVVQNLWGEALLLAAKTFPELCDSDGRILAHVREACSHVIVDVRKCSPGPKSLLEVIKYLFKDIVGTAKGESGRPERLPPEVWAKVFEAFDGTRTTQGSRGLMSLADLADTTTSVDVRTGKLVTKVGKQCECGARGYWRVWRRPMTPEEKAAIEEKRKGRGLAKARAKDPYQERLVGT